MRILVFGTLIHAIIAINAPGTVLPPANNSSNSSSLPTYVGCVKRSPEVSLAIWHFCSRSNLTVPSSYASRFDQGNVTLGIEASCNPPKRIKEETCRDRFFGMCVGSGDNTVKILKSFGKNDCQNWIIHRGDAVNGTLTPINGTQPLNTTMTHNTTQPKHP